MTQHEERLTNLRRRAAFERDDLPSWTSPELKARIAGVLKR